MISNPATTVERFRQLRAVTLMTMVLITISALGCTEDFFDMEAGDLKPAPDGTIEDTLYSDYTDGFSNEVEGTPDIHRTDTRKQDVFKSDTSAPDMDKPDTSIQDTYKPDTHIQDTYKPDTYLDPNIYSQVPNVSSCIEGALTNVEKQRVLNRLNEIRALHALKPVSYEASDDIYVQEASLIIVANAELTHYPDSSMKCYSEAGKTGSSTSNLYMAFGGADSYPSESFVDGWLIDTDVEELGHRRWLLDPFLKVTSYGRVDGKPLVNIGWDEVIGAALKVMGGEEQDISDLAADFVAYPYEDYPGELFDTGWYFSFSVIADKTNYWNNENVDFSGVTISITNGSGQKMTVHSIGSDNTGYGIPNFLKWKATGIQKGVSYHVVISNVTVLGTKKTYAYDFKLQ